MERRRVTGELQLERELEGVRKKKEIEYQRVVTNRAKVCFSRAFWAPKSTVRGIPVASRASPLIPEVLRLQSNSVSTALCPHLGIATSLCVCLATALQPPFRPEIKAPRKECVLNAKY